MWIFLGILYRKEFNIGNLAFIVMVGGVEFRGYYETIDFKGLYLIEI